MIDYALTPPYEGEPFSSVERLQDGKRMRRTVIVPPLPLLRVRAIISRQRQAEADRASSSPPASAWDTVIEEQVPVIKEAMLRNYPEITDDELADIVTIKNCKQMYYAAMGLDVKLVDGRPNADGMQAGEVKAVTVSQ
jgi:hypothetical protein